MDDKQRHPPRSGPGRGDGPASQRRPGNNSGGLLSRYRAGEGNGGGNAAVPPEAATPPPPAAPSRAPVRSAPASRQPANPPRSGAGASWHRYDPASGQWVDPATQDGSVEQEPPAPVSTAPSDHAPSADAGAPRRGGLLSRFAQVEEAAGRAWGSLTSQGRAAFEGVRGAAGGTRRPTDGDWRASDYDPEELDRLIESEEVASQRVPPRDGAPASRGYRDSAGRSEGGARGAGRQPPTGSRRPTDWDDEEEWDRDWEAGWETGTWDTGWATNWRNAAPEAGYNDYEDYGYDPEGGWDQRDGYGDDAWSRSLVALGAASMAEIPMGRIARIRMVVRERPAAGAMLVVFLLGFVLTCVAPLIPLMRLGYDVADAARRASQLQKLVSQDPTQLIRPDQLAAVQTDVNGLEHDLYEINAVTNVLGAPLAKVSHKLADYRLLVRMGFDLTAAGDEGLQVARILLVPLQGGALVASDSSPGITADDIQQARGLLADAKVRVQDAVSAYQQLDQAALPSQLRPGSRYGSLLALLPTSAGIFDELNTLISIAPGLLGVGQPAHYLVLAMDRTELRPGGGFQGNFGILTLVGGKQPAADPLSLQDTYSKLDQPFYQNSISHGDPNVNKFLADQCTAANEGKIPTVPPQKYFGAEQPRYYWWWPYQDFSWCFNWGVRDSNLSADFPTNARDAMAIAQQTPGVITDGAPLQGAVAFTPQLIGALLNVPGIGPITLSDFPQDPPVTAANLEQQIHCHQLPFGSCPSNDNAGGTDRKTYTHLLSQAVLAKIKQLHGSALKEVVQVALNALKTKDLQVYFADPRAELILQQLGLSSQIQTGNGDGFFVVDTNDGGNKANLYVSEHQEDLVTLLPNGGAVHRLKITVTYAYPKGGWVFADPGTPEDYNDVQRVYMPGDATILGYNGYAIPQSQTQFEPQPLNNCSDIQHCFYTPITNSDVAGRTMVMGFVDVSCHDDLSSGQPMYHTLWQESGQSDGQACNLNPNTNTQTISIEWYSPNAWTPTSAGHGSYSDLVEKQAGTDGPPSATNPSGSVNSLTVFVDTSLLHGTPQPTDWTNTDLRAAALAHATKVYDQPLASDTTVSFNF